MAETPPVVKKSYYNENREIILKKNKEYYHKKKNDPNFYKKVLDRNKKCYNKKQLPALTKEDIEKDEKQMYDVIEWVKTLREMDKNKPKNDPIKSRSEMTEYFNHFMS
jgi:hypothetical protein